jgi:hypothetical protein
MQPGVLLIMSLLAWYLAAMLLFWYALREPHPTKRQAMEIPFALKEGQTILGIEDSVQGIDFYIGNSGRVPAGCG